MSSLSNHDRELQNYFTDVEHLREMFKQWLAAPALPKRLLIVHGVGGVGKSSLLRMFRLHCKSVGVPVALASGDEQKSALDVLTRWADDLKTDGVTLPEFRKTFQQYRTIQAKVENEASKMAGKLAKGAAATVVETVASTIPGIGPLVGKLGGMGAEALVDWLRGFLTKPDIDLLLDPAKKLTADFLADLEKVASKRRIVLMLDTFEQMTALDDWAREIAQRLHVNTLLIIAGRALPNWHRAWSGWMANAHVEELKPMSEDDMRELIRRYYATLRGGEPDPKQVQAIIRFARGLPMVVTSAVQLWVKYGVEDFQAVKPEIVANLVDRLMEGVPKGMVPALEAAAVVRWFDQPILRAVMKQDDVRDVYNELRRFPFVRTRTEGLALHDAVREMVDENLRVQDAERHRELHERAAAYFEKRLEKATGEEAERFGLERLYHRIRADEEAGIQLFQEMAEELVRYRLVSRLRALLNDVNTYPLERENSRLWREYYNARLVHLEGEYSGLLGQVTYAEKVYQSITNNEYSDSNLLAYALHDLGRTLRGRRISSPDFLERIISCFQKSLTIRTLDYKLAEGLLELGMVYRDKGDWNKALQYLNQALDFYDKHNDRYGLVNAYLRLGWYYTYRGDWPNGMALYPKCIEIVHYLGNPISLQIATANWMVWRWTGRLAQVEQGLQQEFELIKNIGLQRDYETRDTGLIAGLADKFDLAESHFLRDLERSRTFLSYTPRDEAVALGFYGIVLVRKGELVKAIELLSQSASIKQSIHDTSYLLETINWLGIAYEILGQYPEAEKCYQQNIDEYKWTGRLYFHCGALTGLIRVKHAQGDYAAIPPLLAEAEQLAQQYEYNDHLASLRLTQGHIAWEGNAPAWENGFDAALRYYQQALIYALRYNRFLLDEVLSGRPQGTPLRPIIPECLKRGEEGRRMLIALRDWWRTGINDIGAPRPDTISPIPEGIALLEAERIARQREPGDGSPQRNVVEQIENALVFGGGY